MSDIFLAVSKFAKNSIKNPFYPANDVEWSVSDSFKDGEFDALKDSAGNFIISIYPSEDNSIFDITCKNRTTGNETVFNIKTVKIPQNIEIAEGDFSEFQYPGNIWKFNNKISSFSDERTTVDILPDKIKINGKVSGFDNISLTFFNENVLNVTAEIKIRITKKKEEPVNIIDQNKTSVTTPIHFPEIEEKIIEQKFNRPVIKPAKTVKECVVSVTIKSTGKIVKEVGLLLTKSILVGKASSSSTPAADIDIKPYLSKEGELKCSRKQIKILISDGKIYVKNTGSFPVVIDNGEELTPEDGNYFNPGVEVLIAGEIIITIKEKGL